MSASGITTRFYRFGFPAAAAIMLASAAAGLSAPLGAAATTTITVTTTADTAPGTSCSTGSCSLRSSIEAANKMASATINVPAGKYVLDHGGQLEISGEVTVVGSGQGQTIVDGDQHHRVFEVDSDASLTMSGLTVQHGQGACSVEQSSDRGGGGIQNQGALSLTQVTVDSNQTCLGSNFTQVPGSGADGGGIEQLGGGKTSLSNSTVSNNKALFGGGVVEANLGTAKGEVTMTNSTVTGNEAFIYGGGAIEEGGGKMTISHSAITGNRAHNEIEASRQLGDVAGASEDGGGTLEIEDSIIDGNVSDNQGGGVTEDGGGTLIVRRSIVSNNSAADSAGGMYLDGGGTVSIDTVLVKNNHVTGLEPTHNLFSGSGGGINEDGGDTVSIDNTEVTGNTAGYAAGILLDGGGDFTITRTTVDGNTATALGDKAITEDGMGGGILNDGGDTVHLTNSTIDGNKATVGGSGYVLPNLSRGTAPRSRGRAHATRLSTAQDSTQIQTLLNDTITDNKTADPTAGGNIANGFAASLMVLENTVVAGGSPVNCSGKVTSQGHNLDSGTSCALAGTGDISNRDPQLQPLASNGPGGPPTRLPKSTSPVIDAADPHCPATDERGVARPQGRACDIGAVEIRAADFPPPPTPVALPSTGGAPSAGLDGRPAALLGTLILAAAVVLARRRRPQS